MDKVETLGYLFYVVSPNRTSFEKVEDVPDYRVKVGPYFSVLVMSEILIMKLKNDPVRLNDAFGSISQGVLSETIRILLESWKIACYIYIYTNWRLVDLPWDSLWTWWIAFITVDFIYYWAHRASHEINFLWAAHQVHHSSEDYNLSTALRQSVLQSYFLWVINKLGPLEYIINTASHHRVHHGRNRYCIDKNYAGVLIIWDRMFGTFEPEGDEVVYGLTHPINSFEPIYIQTCHLMHIWRTFWSTEGTWNKLSVIFKGPGWSPGKPRLGSIEDIPDVKAPIEKYDPALSFWCKVYALYHLQIIALLYVEMNEGDHVIPPPILYGTIIYEIFSLSVIGRLLEARPYAAWLELLRCILYVVLDYYFIPWTRISTLEPLYQLALLTFIRMNFLVSGIIWLRQCVKSVTITWHSKSEKLE